MTEAGCTAQPHYVTCNLKNRLLLYIIILPYLSFLTQIKGRVFATRSAGPLPPSQLKPRHLVISRVRTDGGFSPLEPR